MISGEHGNGGIARRHKHHDARGRGRLNGVGKNNGKILFTLVPLIKMVERIDAHDHDERQHESRHGGVGRRR